MSKKRREFVLLVRDITLFVRARAVRALRDVAGRPRAARAHTHLTSGNFPETHVNSVHVRHVPRVGLAPSALDLVRERVKLKERSILF